MSEAVILEAVRTPFGKRGGALRDIRPDALLATALRGAGARAGLPLDRVEDVICGTVSQAGEQGGNIGRLGALLAGFPATVPGVSLNRMCGSSHQALHFASQAVAAGDAHYTLACGVESMSRVPIFLDLTLGAAPFDGFDGLNPDLLARHELVHQAESAERVAELNGITRAECDGFSAESHRRAAAAQNSNVFSEILPVEGLDAEGRPKMLERDEGVRPTVDPDRMASLPLAFRPPGKGVITAGNSSQMSDAASAVLIGDAEAARADGLRARARFRSRVVVGSDPTLQFTGLGPAIEKALSRAGLSLADLDWIEVNEAFAPAVLAWTRQAGPDMAKLNPWGGAIAHGHPLGATATGLLAKMLNGLVRGDGQFGLLAVCIGHGMATATVVERIS